MYKFTFKYLEEAFNLALEYGYHIIKCEEYLEYKYHYDKVLINRVDIDLTCIGAKRISEIFNRLNIKGTFFVRLHAEEYNPFSFENYKSLKYIVDNGHEVGLHSEIIDASKYWKLSSTKVLLRDIDILNEMLGIKIKGIASHNQETGNNNLDFWKDKKPADFGLLYEAYDNQPEFNLFNESVYVTDSNYTYWKCYKKGIMDENDKRWLHEHIKDNNKILYTLIHPITYMEN